MNICASPGTPVRYTGATEEQARWGGCDDPRDLLSDGAVYTVEAIEIHSWHARVKLLHQPGQFNSVCFEDVS